MNRYLEKIAKRVDLEWWTQALDNTSDNLNSGRRSLEETVKGKASSLSKIHGDASVGDARVVRDKIGRAHV